LNVATEDEGDFDGEVEQQEEEEQHEEL